MTTIGPSLVITGELTSKEEITIHGRVKGQINMKEGALMVAPAGKVDADVHAARVTIHGSLAGNVAAMERIELAATAEVTGTLMTPAIVMREGATFNGTLDVEKKNGTKAATKPELVAKAG